MPWSAPGLTIATLSSTVLPSFPFPNSKEFRMLLPVSCYRKNSATSAGPLLNCLHWLPVHSRINFKIATITYKSLHSQSSGYLASMLHHYMPTRNLCSSNSLLLSPHPAKTNFGLHAFQFATLNIWNKLPIGRQVCMLHIIFQSPP